MDTLSMLRMFVDSNVCVQDARGLLLDTGHSPVEVQEAINTMIEEGSSVTWTSAAYPRNANIFFHPLDTD